ncbi:uncharacterized protein J4E88_003861 [Alternaria novae-zelandiae]|uniref:uncharacterized protein n=1 Tax=Alternaria novae-zelandiae TaxID=430562 RepID=UPI0020C3C9AF|nr:uncharacterized protein J4E88_003861 [Alternaria novae-zelandiae]KAI4686024.1 hypothetical protein J4E88_003861 [Alternaria novae-zelandiae]
MVSDGKRMRILWRDGDGNGDSNKAFVMRSKTTVRGHPTWKMYMAKVPRPVIYGRQEPPRYVYLDDKACYAVYNSQTYTAKELSTFWPYDFDNLGNIKASRPNRGRPAYLENSTTVFARGPLRRSKLTEYEFCGRPASSGQQTPDWRVKRAAEEAQAKRIEAGTQISLSGTMPAMHKPRPYVPGPIDGRIKPLSITDRAIQGSPYFDIPAAAMRKRPRPVPGDMAAVYAGFTSNRNAEATAASAVPESKRVKVKQEVDIQNELLAMIEKLDSSE